MVEFENGTAYRAESKDMAETINAGRLFEQPGLMNPERVRIEVSDHVADVRLVRADKHNGLDWPMFVALNDAVDEVRGSEGVRAVVLSGEGPSFCAGLDVKSFAVR